jgi:hypothetical protein
LLAALQATSTAIFNHEKSESTSFQFGSRSFYREPTSLGWNCTEIIVEATPIERRAKVLQRLTVEIDDSKHYFYRMVPTPTSVQRVLDGLSNKDVDAAFETVLCRITSGAFAARRRRIKNPCQGHAFTTPFQTSLYRRSVQGSM